MTVTDEAAAVAARTAAAGAAPGAAPAPWVGTAVALFSAACFGTIATFGRLAYDGGSNPLTIVFLRAAGVVVAVGLFLVVVRRPMRLTRRAFRSTLWLGAVAIVMAWGFLGAVAYIPVSLTALILYTYPLMVAVLATLTGRERMTAVKLAALLGAFAGLGLALGPPLADLDPRGLALAFGAAISICIAVTYGGQALAGHDTLVMNFYTNLWAMLVFAAVLLAGGWFALPVTALGLFGAGAAAGIYVAAFVSWFIAMRLVKPVRMSVLFNLDALVNILGGVLVLGEPLDTQQVIGVLLVLACLVVMAAHRAD
jgi:drug/metabolite transporter (DMT)-like permease